MKSVSKERLLLARSHGYVVMWVVSLRLYD